MIADVLLSAKILAEDIHKGREASKELSDINSIWLE
jgi:hypothetical protein